MSQPKNKAGLVPVKKLVKRKDGSTHTATFWVRPEEVTEGKRRNAKNKSTKFLHTDSNGKYTPKREKLHQAVITREVKKLKKPKKGEKPKVVMLLGGAASGKSTAERNYITPKYGDALGVVNVDDVKDDLPEFDRFKRENVDTAASRVHEESSDIGKQIVSQAIEGGRNFIYDAVLGKPEKAKKMIEKLRAKGYEIELVGVSLDTDEAVSRAIARADRSGRMVPEDILREGHAGAVDTFEAIKDLVDSAVLFDNHQEFGGKPTMAYQRDKGGEAQIHNQEMYDRFLAKAKSKLKKAISIINRLLKFGV